MKRPLTTLFTTFFMIAHWQWRKGAEGIFSTFVLLLLGISPYLLIEWMNRSLRISYVRSPYPGCSFLFILEIGGVWKKKQPSSWVLNGVEITSSKSRWFSGIFFETGRRDRILAWVVARLFVRQLENSSVHWHQNVFFWNLGSDRIVIKYWLIKIINYAREGERERGKTIGCFFFFKFNKRFDQNYRCPYRRMYIWGWVGV